MLANRFTSKSFRALITSAALGALIIAPSAATAADGQSHVGFSAAGHYLAGRHAEQVGEDTQALTFYGTATTRGQIATSDLYRRIYFLALTEGRIDEALRALDKVEKLGGRAPFANLARAIHALKIKNYAHVEDLMKSETTGLAGLLAPAIIAWSKVGEDDLGVALEKLATMKEKPGLDALHDLHAALIHEQTGDTQKSEEYYLNVLTKAGMSVRVAQLLGWHFERLGQPEKALELYSKFATDGEGDTMLALAKARIKSKRRPPVDIATPQAGAAEALFNIASVLQAQAGGDRVLVLSHLALYLRPDLAPAKMVVAAARESGKRYEDAIAIYEDIPKNSPLVWNARMHMADNLDRMGKTDASVRMLKGLAKERPKRAAPLIELGDVLRRHERFKEAITAYSDALKRIGEPETRHWTIFYARGIAYEQTKQWPKAEADFLTALSFEPDQPLVLNYLGYSWIDQGLHLDRALKMIEKAVDLRPRDGYIVDSLGWGLYRLGRYPEAVKKMERAVMLRPADPVINDHLGDVLWRVGRIREARFQWERAKTLGPDDKLDKELDLKLKGGLDAVTSK